MWNVCVMFISSAADPSVGGLLDVGCVDFQNILKHPSQPASSQTPFNLTMKS
jgi:hypothetical protein